MQFPSVPCQGCLEEAAQIGLFDRSVLLPGEQLTPPERVAHVNAAPYCCVADPQTVLGGRLSPDACWLVHATCATRREPPEFPQLPWWLCRQIGRTNPTIRWVRAPCRAPLTRPWAAPPRAAWHPRRQSPWRRRALPRSRRQWLTPHRREILALVASRGAAMQLIARIRCPSSLPADQGAIVASVSMLSPELQQNCGQLKECVRVSEHVQKRRRLHSAACPCTLGLTPRAP